MSTVTHRTAFGLGSDMLNTRTAVGPVAKPDPADALPVLEPEPGAPCTCHAGIAFSGWDAGCPLCGRPLVADVSFVKAAQAAEEAIRHPRPR